MQHQRRSRRLSAPLLAVAGLLVVAVSGAVAADWATYRNARFGYAIEHPAFLVPGQEAVNGDGRGFRSRDGQVTMRVSARLLGEEETLDAEVRAAVKRFARGRITYQRRKANWFVISGYVADGLIFYQAIMAYRAPTNAAMRGAPIIATFELTWPEAARGRVDRHVGRILRSFIRSGRN